MTTAEAQVEQLQKEKQEAEIALAQSRQELRRLSATGSANPNFPAGVQRGTMNKSLNPPLFKTVRASIQTPSCLHALQTDPIPVICFVTESHCGRGVAPAGKVEWP